MSDFYTHPKYDNWLLSQAEKHHEGDDVDSETICQCGVTVNDEPVCYWCGWNHKEQKYEPEAV